MSPAMRCQAKWKRPTGIINHTHTPHGGIVRKQVKVCLPRHVASASGCFHTVSAPDIELHAVSAPDIELHAQNHSAQALVHKVTAGTGEEWCSTALYFVSVLTLQLQKIQYSSALACTNQAVGHSYGVLACLHKADFL